MTTKKDTISLLLPKNGRPLFAGKALLEKIDFNEKYNKKDENVLIKKESIYAIIVALKCLSNYFIEVDNKGLAITKEDYKILIKFPLFLSGNFVKDWENHKPWKLFNLRNEVLADYEKVLNGDTPSNGYVTYVKESHDIWEYYVTRVSVTNILGIIDYSISCLANYLNERKESESSLLDHNIKELSDFLKLTQIDRNTFHWLTSLLGDKTLAVQEVWLKLLSHYNYNANSFFASIETALVIPEGLILSRLTNDSPLVKFKLFNNCLNNNQDFNFIELGQNWSSIWAKLSTDIVRFNINVNHSFNNKTLIENIMVENKTETLPLSKWDYLNGILAIWQRQLISGPTKILFHGIKGSGKKSLSMSLLNTLKIKAYTPAQSKDLSLLGLSCSILEHLDNSALYMENNIEALNKFETIHDIKCNILWNVENIDKIPADILSGFDYIYDLSDIPFENRLEFAKETFEDVNLAIKISQQLKTFGGIKKAAKLVKTNEDWKTIYPHVNIEKSKTNDFFTMFDYSSFKDIPDLVGYKDLDIVFNNIVDMYENPVKYEKLKAKVPKGFILEGSPGTGKTLFVKTVAKKTQLPLIVAKTNQLVENLKELSNLFDFARMSAPCILFFDEIDTLLVEPSTMFGKDTKKQMVLNTMLTEIDGVKSLAGVTIIGTTNHLSSISKSALRSGRLSKIVRVNSPNPDDRKQIWHSYLHTRPTDNIDYEYLTKISNGFSGADIAEAVNESALYAAINMSDTLKMEHINKAWETIVFGLPNGLHVKKEDLFKTAIHEMGHALVAAAHEKEVSLITIIPRHNALGITAIMKEEGVNSMSLTEMKTKVKIFLGGIAAEKVYFNEYESGGSSDLFFIKNIITTSFLELGFNDKIGKVSDDERKDWSEKKRVLFETEVKDLIDKLFLETESFLSKNKTLLEKCAKELEKHKTISYEKIEIWKKEIVK